MGCGSTGYLYCLAPAQQFSFESVLLGSSNKVARGREPGSTWALKPWAENGLVQRGPRVKDSEVCILCLLNSSIVVIK